MEGEFDANIATPFFPSLAGRRKKREREDLANEIGADVFGLRTPKDGDGDR